MTLRPLQRLPEEDERAFDAERLSTNLSRLKIAGWLGVAGHALHVLVFLFTAPAREAAQTAHWRSGVIGVHLVMMGVALLVVVGSRSRLHFPWLARQTPIFFALAYLVAGAALTGIDQAVTPDTTPWLLVVFGVVLLVRLDWRTMGGLLGGGWVLYLAGQWLMQPNLEVRLSNSVKGLSVTLVGVLLAAVLDRQERREFQQRCLIERQRAELEVALAEARSAASTAEQASRAKSAFLAIMSHELRTPMTGVLGVAELLAATPLDANQRHLLWTVQESGSTLVALISDLLDVSKAEAGHLVVEARPFEVSREVDAVVRLFEPRAQAKGLQLRSRWEGAPPPLLRGDALRLRQVLSNLVGNALKFTALGQVELRCQAVRREERWALQLAVADTGPGMTGEVLERLFKPWSQADESTFRTYGGSGLGLAISHQLAVAMGGDLVAHSEAGRGSTFTLTLQLDAAAPGEVSAAAPLEAIEPAEALSGRVLVADDNSVNQLVASGILRQLGLEVEVTGDGAGAEALLRRHSFDAVLTDLHMPGIDGLDLLRWVRSQAGALGRLPVVVVTADVSLAERDACLASGANAVLPKPFRASELKACLRANVPALRSRPAA